jgi:hypothetical protein
VVALTVGLRTGPSSLNLDGREESEEEENITRDRKRDFIYF